MVSRTKEWKGLFANNVWHTGGLHSGEFGSKRCKLFYQKTNLFTNIYICRVYCPGTSFVRLKFGVWGWRGSRRASSSVASATGPLSTTRDTRVVCLKLIHVVRRISSSDPQPGPAHRRRSICNYHRICVNYTCVSNFPTKLA